MSKFYITLFNGEGTNKNPKSKDGSFIFANKECSTLEEGYEVLNCNWSLSKHLELEKPIKGALTTKNLKEYIPYKLSSLVIELNAIFNHFNHQAIMDYFKEKKYSCLIFKGPKYDGFDNFNTRVLLRTNITNNSKYIKIFLEELQNELGSKCLVDTDAKSIHNAYNPALVEKGILFKKEKGRVLNDSDIFISKVQDIIDDSLVGPLDDTDEIDLILENKKKFPKYFIEKCLEIFFEEGFSIIPNNKGLQNSKAFQFSKDNDKQYFWYPTNPFIMNHSDKTKKNSIFGTIKKTKEGKEWLKTQTKEEQNKELIKPQDLTQYKESIICDERYLDLKKRDKIKLINNFLLSEKGVFKIKSAMGTAKSNVIDEIIKRATKRKEKVIIVSNRISVAMDFAEKYNIKTYQDFSTIQSKESVIVQFDSLHKYNPLDYDIVIFDEYASLLLHHRAGLTDNSNINAVKFKILSDSKRVVIADAFLTGYEDQFFLGRDIFALYNNYRDDIQIFEYKNKDRFVTEIINRSENLKEKEHISCSFTSLQMMRIVENELSQKGIRVVTLSSETNEITREIIYKRFKEETHNAFEVILFTPTLTVGVSNLNNIVSHFHYDSGMATDVISSLQMIKRSRLSQEIHYYIEERQKYNDTNLNSINAITKDKIGDFYKNKDKTLLVDIDYNTGEMELTPLALYINKIEVFYNVLENNHGNAFRLLLQYQFGSNLTEITEKTQNIKITEKSRAIKNKLRENKLTILEKYSDTQWDYFEIQEIKQKIAQKTEEEQVKLLIFDIQEKFSKKLPKKTLILLAQLEIESDFQFINYIKNMKTMLNPDFDAYAKYELSNALSDDIKSLQNKDQLQFLQYILKLPYNFILESSYDKKDIQAMNEKLKIGNKFAKFLNQLGYISKEGKLEADIRVYKFLNFL